MDRPWIVLGVLYCFVTNWDLTGPFRLDGIPSWMVSYHLHLANPAVSCACQKESVTSICSRLLPLITRICRFSLKLVLGLSSLLCLYDALLFLEYLIEYLSKKCSKQPASNNLLVRGKQTRENAGFFTWLRISSFRFKAWFANPKVCKVMAPALRQESFKSRCARAKCAYACNLLWQTVDFFKIVLNI